MNILNQNAIEEISKLFNETNIAETESAEAIRFDGSQSEKFAFFNPKSGYGAHIATGTNGNVEVRLLDVTPDKWDGIAGWDLVHLTIDGEGTGTRIFRGKVDGTFTVKSDLSGIDLLKLIRRQYPEELNWLNKLNIGEL